LVKWVWLNNGRKLENGNPKRNNAKKVFKRALERRNLATMAQPIGWEKNLNNGLEPQATQAKKNNN